MGLKTLFFQVTLVKNSKVLIFARVMILTKSCMLGSGGIQ
jgi:hypothetical protein